MPVALPALAVDMVLVLAALILVVLLETAQLWLRPIINAVMHPHTALWKRVLTAPFRYVLGPAAHYALEFARRFIAWNVHAILRPSVRFLRSLALLYGEIADLILYFPADVHWALYYLRHVVIPTLIEAAVAPVAKLAVDAKELALGLERDLARTAGAIADALNSIGWKTVADPFGALRNLAHAVAHLWRYVYGELTASVAALEHEAVVVGHELADIHDRLYRYVAGQIARMEATLERELDTIYIDLKPFVDALRAGVIPAAMVGAIALALSKIWDGLFCRNTNQVGRVLCGLDSGLLDAFLVGITLELELGGLVELTRELQGVVQESAAAIRVLAEV